MLRSTISRLVSHALHSRRPPADPGASGPSSLASRRPGSAFPALAALAVVLAGAAFSAPSASAGALTTGRIVSVPAAGATTESSATASALGATGERSEAATASRPGSRLFDARSRFDLIGVLFQTTGATRSDEVAVTLRVSRDLVHWTRWVTLRADEAARPGSVQSRRDYVSDPVWVGAGRYVQYLVTPRVGVQDVRFACVQSETSSLDAEAGAPDATTIGDASGADVPALASAIGGTGSSPAAAPLGMPARPVIITRAQWGARESYRSDGPYYGEVRCAFVHHTVNANGYTRRQAPALVRGIYYYHTHVNGWSDIGYNFLIDRFGRIYEGRYGGVTHAVIGAQVLGFNSWSTGISIIGTYSSVKPSAKALDALERLLAWKLDVHHDDPLGTARIQCSTTSKYRAGQWVTVPVILGHRDVNYTECPGNALYGLLPTIRKAVAAIGNPKLFAPRVSPAPFSPNGDGVKDKTTAAAGLSEEADWTVTVKNSAGTVVRTMTGSGAAVAAAWDGRDDAGVRCPDGAYTLRIGAANADGTARAATVPVHIDTVPPKTPVLTLKRTVVSPNGDHVADSLRASFTLAQSCKVRVLVRDGGGAIVRTVNSWATLSAGGHAAVWDGRVTAGSVAPDGPYTLVAQARDGAGNQAAARAAFTVDDTLGHPAVAPAWISPNGDGTNDQTTLRFTTTRSAEVTIEVRDGADALVRRLALGSLTPGPQEAAWDGLRDDGTTVASGRYQCTATAVESVGSVTLPFVVRVDLVRPQPAWRSPTATVVLGKTLHARYSVTDRFSPKVRVKVSAKAADGSVAGAWGPTWLATGKSLVRDFKPSARGVYTLLLYATDRAGNKQAHPASLVVTVK